MSKINTLPILNIEYLISESKLNVPQSRLDDNSWSFDDMVIEQLRLKIKDSGVPLSKYCNKKINRGILSGLDEVFIINNNTKEQLEKVHYSSKELIKPILLGKQIKRYYNEWNNSYIILLKKGTKVENYPAIFQYLKDYKERLEKRNDKGDYWYDLRTCNFYDDFNVPKIVYAHFSQKPHFTYDENNFYVNPKGYIIPTDDKYLLGILNSSVIAFYSPKVCPFVRGKYFEFNKQFVKDFPIPIVSKTCKEDIIKLVNNILDLNKFLLSKKKTFINRVISELKTDQKLPLKIKNFYNLKVEEFLSIIKIILKNKVSLTKLDEWEEYFISYKNKITEINNQIILIEKQLDNVIYSLYNITEEEKK